MIEDPYGYIIPLINYWYKKADTETDYFNKFISLWISFNAFYSNFSDEETENKQIRKIADYEPFQGIFANNILEEISDFHSYINNRELYLFSQINKGIGNLSCYKKYKSNITLDDNEESLIKKGFTVSKNGIFIKNGRRIEMLVRYYDEVSDLESFLFVLYQIRCNLFHGGKNPRDQSDKDVIEKSVPALKKFLEMLYIDNGINVS